MSSNHYMYLEFQTLSLHFGNCCWQSSIDACASSYIWCSAFSADARGSGSLKMWKENWKSELFLSFFLIHSHSQNSSLNMINFRNTYVKTVRSSSITMLPGSLLCLRCPVSQSIFKIHSLPSLPCLQME